MLKGKKSMLQGFVGAKRIVVLCLILIMLFGVAAIPASAYTNGSYYLKNALKPTKLDVISVLDMTEPEETMIASLQGIIATQSTEQIYILDAIDSDYQIWLDDLKVNYGITTQTYTDPWALLDKFKAYVKGYNLYTSNANTVAKSLRYKYEAEGTQLQHAIGRLDGTAWSANTAQDAPGHMIYGPYTTSTAGGINNVLFTMMEDVITGTNDTVAIIDVNDVTSGTVLASKTITRNMFTTANRYQNFVLSINNTVGHNLEFRVWWADKAGMKVDKIETKAIENTDPSINNASSEAGINSWIPVEQTMQNTVNAHGITFKTDRRGTDKNWAKNNLWTSLNHSISISIRPSGATPLRDYAMMTKSLCFFEDTGATLNNAVFQSMDQDSVCLGWGVSEDGLVSAASQNGVIIIPADLSYNLTVLSAFPSTNVTQTHATVPTTTGVHYVSFLMSDGDNQQWYLGGAYSSPKWYGSANRGTFNMGWTISPSIYDCAPTVLKKFYSAAKTGTYKDNFIVSPSGSGYIYPSMFPASKVQSNADKLNTYMAKVDQKYISIIDFNALNRTDVWDKYTSQPNINGIIYLDYSNQAAGQGALVWSNNKPVLSCRDLLWAGLEDEQALINNITAHANATDGTNITKAAAYTLVYVHAWSKDMNNVKSVVDSLSTNSKIKIVTPETMMDLVKMNIPNGTNAALNKTATASGQITGEEASKAVDGSITNNSKWCVNATGAKWLKVDLGSSYDISRWVVKHAGAGGESTIYNTKDFKLQKSTDGTTWTDVDAVTGNTANITNRNVTKFSTRYVRLYVTNSGADNAARIYEFEVYAPVWTYEAEGSSLRHTIGRLDGDGWSVNTAQDSQGYMIYGPYANDISAGSRTANFRMLVDNNTANNDNVAVLDIHDVTSNTILASRVVTRQQFTAANTYQNFNLTFNNTAGHTLEFRIWWNKTSYVKVDKITIN